MKRRIPTLALLLAVGTAIPTFGQPGSPPPQNPNVRPQPPAGQQPQPGPDGTYDPMSFYRKNPELMRRYFPHLVNQANPNPPPTLQAKSAPQVLDTFSWNGGTAEEFVDSLKARLSPEPNIIIAPKLRGMAIPEFELKNVTVADMFQALNSLNTDKSALWQLSGSSEPIWVLNPVTDGFGNPFRGGGANVVDPVTGMPLNNRSACQILPVAKYLEEYKIEDITTAVKTAWNMMGIDNGGEMKYHTDTKLLIVVGNQEQLNILTQVLSSLEQQTPPKPPVAAHPAASTDKDDR